MASVVLIPTVLTNVGCKKSSDNAVVPEYGCDTKIVLETLINTPGLPVYNPPRPNGRFRSIWTVSTNEDASFVIKRLMLQS